MNNKLSKSLLVVSCLLAIAGCGSNSNSSINVSTSSSKVTSSTVDEVKGSLLILFKYDSLPLGSLLKVYALEEEEYNDISNEDIPDEIQEHKLLINYLKVKNLYYQK